MCFWSDKKEAPIIPLAFTAHHAPNASSGNGNSWMNMWVFCMSIAVVVRVHVSADVELCFLPKQKECRVYLSTICP